MLQLSVHSAAPSCIHLSKRTLHSAKEVSLFESIMVATDVMELKAEALHFLKIVVNCEDFGENWNDAAAYHLCPIHLEPIRTWQMSHSNSGVLIYSFFFFLNHFGTNFRKFMSFFKTLDKIQNSHHL